MNRNLCSMCILLIISVALRLQAANCPNLTGRYVDCQASALAGIFPAVIEISQNGENYRLVETYGDNSVSDTRVMAGAPPLTQTETDPRAGKVVTTTQTICEGDKLVTNVKTQETSITFYEQSDLALAKGGLELRLWLDQPSPKIEGAPDAVLNCKSSN